MVRTKLDILAEEVLSQLEREEAKALNWGFTGGLFFVEEAVKRAVNNPVTPLLSLLWSELRTEVTANDIVQNLRDRKLIFIKDRLGRTRFAESVHLLYLLKQRFSREDWQFAPNLVSNIKIDLKYRRYPKRELSWDAVSDALAGVMPHSEAGSETVKAMLNGGTLSLAGFQLRSLVHLSLTSRGYRDGSTIVGAGTGSGKTKAFYLPALSVLVENLVEDQAKWTRILALYPRIELLKDQITECLAETEKIGNITMDTRPVSMGAYYGDTPLFATDVDKEDGYYQWERIEMGFECPFLKCPHCNASLCWPFEAHNREIEENSKKKFGCFEMLTCSDTGCGFSVGGERLRLTRKHMQESPPDLLFTTTEMLNRKLFDASDQQIFGIGVKKTPFFVLLDEVHTYNGIKGAHVAYLLRRWRNLVRNYSKGSLVNYVGLSATLANPTDFFSSLTGVEEWCTTYITPSDDEMTSEGMEYNLVLRGDPVSATALLSTSVQACMLMVRMLDPFSEDVSVGAWGKKIFAFSDKLDVLNRWYHIMQDAESELGLYQYRNPSTVIEGTLKEQNKLGQVWGGAQAIEPHCLEREMRIGITSSQSRGVDTSAKLVLATSTLEVGFNDPQVGAVIQHKAARDSASFLQRKGRGGRPRGMRPWTIVVTSAYGLDRWAFEHAEQLFSPTLKETILPLRNSYVQHIQAAFALMDWLSQNLSQRGFRWISVWNMLTPGKSVGKENMKPAKAAVLDVLEQLLSGDYQGLQHFLARSLKLSEFDMYRVLWLPPRSLMFDLIPALHAHLKKDWSQQVKGNRVITRPDRSHAPLIGYIPQNLFSSLDLQGLEIEAPGQRDIQSMMLVQGMVEFAPGNASKRYSRISRRGAAHWLLPPEGTDIMELADSDITAVLIDKLDSGQREVAVFTPIRYRLRDIPYGINDRSTGFLEWETVFRTGVGEGSGQAKVVSLEDAKDMAGLFGSVQVYASPHNSSIKVTRFARSVKLETKSRGETDKRRIRFSHKGEAAALGFTHYVDALAFQVEMPDLRQITHRPLWPSLLRLLRPQFYLQRLKQDVPLSEELSSFEIEWLWQICMSSCMAISISRQLSIADAIRQYRKNVIAVSERTLQVIFQVTPPADQDSFEEGPRLYQRLLGFLQTGWIVEALFRYMSVLTEDLMDTEEFWQWLELRYLSTVAAGLVTAAGDLLPDIDTEELLVDIHDHCIWISENVAGGIGVVSSITGAMESYPQKFSEYFWQAVSSCERHQLSRALTAVVGKSENIAFREAFGKVRQALTLDQQQDALLGLQHVLYLHHIAPRRELIVSLLQKIFGGNSSEDTDCLAVMLHEKWRSEEERLQCAIDPRVFAVASLRDDEVQSEVVRELADVAYGEVQEKQQVILVDSLLWSDCLSSCPECLQLYNRFQTIDEPNRLLMMTIGYPGEGVVDMTDNDWQDKTLKSLKQEGRVKLRLTGEHVENGRQHITDFIQEPVELGFELHFPYLYRAENTGDAWLFDIRIREVLYG